MKLFRGFPRLLRTLVWAIVFGVWASHRGKSPHSKLDLLVRIVSSEMICSDREKHVCRWFLNSFKSLQWCLTTNRWLLNTFAWILRFCSADIWQVAILRAKRQKALFCFAAVIRAFWQIEWHILIYFVYIHFHEAWLPTLTCLAVWWPGQL